MQYITDSQIYDNIVLKECYDWVKTMIEHKKSSILPAKISMKLDGHIFYNVMPCVLPDFNVAGVKIVNRYPSNTPSLKSNLMLYDLTNGDLLSIMDANAITSIRTGAVAAHSALLFAKQDFYSIAAIGLGNVTKMALAFFIEMIGEKNILIKLFKYKNHAEQIIEKYAHKKNVSFKIVDNYNELMSDSDIIFSGITYADKDFCDVNVYKKGCTIIPMHTLGFQNCDLSFDKVFGDDTSHIEGFKYFNKFKSFHEVCDVANGIVPGRTNNEEQILVYNIGIAIHDIYFAYKIHEKFSK